MITGRLNNLGPYCHRILFAKSVVYMLVEDIVVRIELFGDGIIVVSILLRPHIVVLLKLIRVFCGNGDSFGT